MQYGRPRITVINIIKNKEDKFLLALRRHQWIPGYEGWGWFQGGLEVDEEKEFFELLDNASGNIELNTTSSTVIPDLIGNLNHKKQIKMPNLLSEKAKQILINRAKQEIKEETNLDILKLTVVEKPAYSDDEFMSVSIKRFLFLGCQYNVQRKYRFSWFYSKDSHKIKTDFENAGGDWFSKDEVGKKLVPEKLKDWENFLKTI